MNELIPFIYKNMNDSSFEDHWPITGDQFEALNDSLSVKFPKIHAGGRWQAIIQCFTRAMYMVGGVNAWYTLKDADRTLL